MTSGIEDDIEEAYGPSPSGSVFARLRNYLVECESGKHLAAALSAYLEESPVVDWEIASKFVRGCGDPFVAATTINMAALRRCPDRQFWKAVESISRGEEWDSANDARIQAILALNLHPEGCHAGIKEILRLCLSDPSATVRDSAAIAAQRCYGISDLALSAEAPFGTLIERMPPEILAWLHA